VRFLVLILDGINFLNQLIDRHHKRNLLAKFVITTAIMYRL
jgi:hypothetical protein